MRIFILLFFTAILIVGNTVQIYGQSHKQFGVGIQAAPFPIFGVSFKYVPHPKINLQAFGRVGIDVDFFAARCLYCFKTAPSYNIYIDGLIGIFQDTKVNKSPFSPDQTDNALGFGAGAGIEYFFTSNPDIGLNAEIDFIRINFDDTWFKYKYKAPTFVMIGLGVHYYF